MGAFDPKSEDHLALACLGRLIRKGHDAEFESYLARRIAQATEPGNLSYLMKPALAVIRRETYAVDLDGDNVTDANLQSLPGRGLHELTLRGSRVTDARLAVLAKLPSLESLSLDSDSMTDRGLACIEKLAHLETLWLRGSQISDAGLVHLEHLPALKTVDLSGLPITDAGLVHLDGLTKLESVQLEGFGSPARTQISPAAIDRLKKKFPGLRVDGRQ